MANIVTKTKNYLRFSHTLWLAAFLLQVLKAHADHTISQISPKSDNLQLLLEDNFSSNEKQLENTSTTKTLLLEDIQSENYVTNSKNTDENEMNKEIDEQIKLLTEIAESESSSDAQLHQRIVRSASPVLGSSKNALSIQFIDSNEKNHLNAEDKKDSMPDANSRYLNLIQPTSTLSENSLTDHDQSSDIMTKSVPSGSNILENTSHFLLKRGPRLIPSGSPSVQPASTSPIDSSSIKPASVMPIEFQTATAVSSTPDTDHARQNPNPDIQDIITGIVKLLNGNVKVHANTQPQLQPSRRPYTTRINNRGPPRITDVQPLPPGVEDEYELVHQAPTPSSTMRPPLPPYPFDRPEGPIRPFITGVPLPEQIVPSHGSHRPGIISLQQNRPPWQRPRPRPPVIQNTNRRPVLTPPPYKFSGRPAQELRPPDADIQTTTMTLPNSQNTDDLQTHNQIHNNSSPNVSETLEKTQINSDSEQVSQHSPPSKEELTKKKDKSKKPNSSTNLPQPTSAHVAITTTVESALMKTIIHTTSEVHTSQIILTPSPISTPTTLEPSEEQFLPKFSTNFDSLSSTRTPELSQHPTQNTQLKNFSLEQLNISTTTATFIPVTTRTKLPTHSQSTVPSHSLIFHPRPGTVLDDPEFKPGAHARPTTSSKLYNKIQPTNPLQSSNLPPGYGEIFDVTLSAIQGNGGGHSGLQTINIKPHGVGNNDIIISASGDESFVSIDGKRTYLNLFSDASKAQIKHELETIKPTHTEKVPTITKSVTPGILGTGLAKADTDTTSNPLHSTTQTDAQKLQKIQQKPVTLPYSTRPNYRTRPQQPPVRIDTCIVGDDSTCDLAQNEMCKTDVGISSCHCRPGFARRKHREPCRKVVSFLMSLRVDKLYEKRIVWDKLLTDSSSEPYDRLSYEAVRAIDSAMSMTPFSDDFMDAYVNKIYNGDATQGTAGVFLNLTIQLEENGETIRPNIKSDLQKHLLGVIHRRNNNIGDSVLYVESPAGSISNLQDLDECSSIELNDCHPDAVCTNVWGSFRCECSKGLRDPWSDQIQRAGRECHTCSDSYCNNRGMCSYDDTGTQQLCECLGSYYGNQCEVDGEVLAVAIGASVIAVVIITLTLICLVTWSRRWQREQKVTMGSPVFGYMSAASLGSQMKAAQPASYQVTLEDRMRWAQIADVMAQTNHYAAEPVASSRPPSAMYGYPNLQMMNQVTGMGTMANLSMAGTLPMHHHPSANLPPIPLPRYGLGLHSRSNGMRTLENSSSSEEEDRNDLLGRNFQVPRPISRSNGSIANQSGIYYDVDYEPAGGDLYGGTTTTTTTSCNNNSGNNHASSGTVTHGIPMSTYTAGRISTSHYMK